MKMKIKTGDRVRLKTLEQIANSGWYLANADEGNLESYQPKRTNPSCFDIVPDMYKFFGTTVTVNCYRRDAGEFCIKEDEEGYFFDIWMVDYIEDPAIKLLKEDKTPMLTLHDFITLLDDNTSVRVCQGASRHQFPPINRQGFDFIMYNMDTPIKKIMLSYDSNDETHLDVFLISQVT